VSLYIRQWDSKADLYGLIRGVRIRFHSVVKKTSKKSNSYLVTTLFSKIEILEAFPYVDATSGSGALTGNEDDLTFLIDLTDSSASAIKCLFTVDRILKLSICANCSYCGNIIRNEVCSFVGCHARISHQDPKINVNSLIQVEDGTSSALLVCQDSNQVKQIFKLSPEEWFELEKQTKSKGELLYISSGKERHDKSSTFEFFCDWFPTLNLCQFYCLCRPFKKSKNEASNIQKLYCIDILN